MDKTQRNLVGATSALLALNAFAQVDTYPERPVRTLAEQGLPGFETSAWSGLVAPAGTRRSIIIKLNEAVNAALKDPNTVKRLSPGGELQILGGSPENFSKYIRSEIAKWQKVVKSNNIQTD